MPSELDAHDILFSPLKKRRAEQAARRAAAPLEGAESTPVRSRADSYAPATDRAVAYAIADAEPAPLISSKAIGGIAVVAAITTAAILMRGPKLEPSAQHETNADEHPWWTAARQQWADESMRIWPIIVRKGRPTTASFAAVKAPASSGTPSSKTGGVAPSGPRVPSGSDNPYSSAAQATPRAPTKASDNPYGDSPAPRACKPAAASTDNPY